MGYLRLHVLRSNTWLGMSAGGTLAKQNVVL